MSRVRKDISKSFEEVFAIHILAFYFLSLLNLALWNSSANINDYSEFKVLWIGWKTDFSFFAYSTHWELCETIILQKKKKYNKKRQASDGSSHAFSVITFFPKSLINILENMQYKDSIISTVWFSLCRGAGRKMIYKYKKLNPGIQPLGY